MIISYLLEKCFLFKKAVLLLFLYSWKAKIAFVILQALVVYSCNSSYSNWLACLTHNIHHTTHKTHNTDSSHSTHSTHSTHITHITHITHSTLVIIRHHNSNMILCLVLEVAYLVLLNACNCCVALFILTISLSIHPFNPTKHNRLLLAMLNLSKVS